MDPVGTPRAKTPATPGEGSKEPMVRLRKQGAPVPQSNPGTWPVFRVLLIEDNKWDADLTQQLLKESGNTGFTIEWSQRLGDGLTRLARGDLDLVLLDLSLPDSRGLATVAKLRAEAPQIPLIVLTGLEDESIGTESIKLGAEDYLVKGRFDGHLLVRAMRYGVERHRLQQERRAALEWKKELDHLREVDRLRTLFMNTSGGPSATLRGPETDESERAPQEKLLDLLDRLIDITQIQDGTASLHVENVDLNQLVREIVESYQPSAEKNNLNLEQFVEGPLAIDIDPLRIIQVLRSLLNNAIKFSSTGGRILVETLVKDNQAVVHVRDTGMGISREDQAALFKSPPRTGSAHLVVPTGFSLFIAKHFVELHGGQIWAFSDGPGFGSTFSFSLPLRAGNA